MSDPIQTSCTTTYTTEEINALYEEGQLPGAKGAPIGPSSNASLEECQAWCESATNVPPHLRSGAPQRRVVCAANRHLDTGLIVCGPRHYDPIMRAVMRAAGGFPHWLRCDQGFVDQFGAWMSREEAWRVADAAGQIHLFPPDGKGPLIRREPNVGDEGYLFSENLY